MFAGVLQPLRVGRLLIPATLPHRYDGAYWLIWPPEPPKRGFSVTEVRRRAILQTV
jgi:hypothetical protein